MGWLRDHGAHKVVALRARSEGAFDNAPPVSDDVLAKEMAMWDQWHHEEEKRLVERYHQALQVVKEIDARDKAPRGRGRPPKLASYAECKRVACANWITFISESATDLDQEQLAKELGFENDKNDGSNCPELRRLLRFVKGGTKGKAGGHNRMPTERVAKIEKAVREHGWAKRGNITFPWAFSPLFSPERWEVWASDVAGMTLEEYKECCSIENQAAWS